MNRKFIETNIERVAYVIEMVIALFVIFGLIIGLKDFLLYFGVLFEASFKDTYELFQSFLGYALLLIVGVELISMIIYHSTQAILELVLFVIARKMLIYSHDMMDLVLGTIALTIVFLTLRYFAPKGEEDTLKRDSHESYGGDVMLKSIHESEEMNLNQQASKLTVSDFVEQLAESQFRPLERGEVFFAGSKKIVVTKVEDGKVEEVVISDKK